jgi:hypothetical protein
MDLLYFCLNNECLCVFAAASLRLKSLHQLPYHLVHSSWNVFLTNEWYSIYAMAEHGAAFGEEILEDRDIYGKHSRYKNIFAMRAAKIRYLVEDLPRVLKHYCPKPKFSDNPKRLLQRHFGKSHRKKQVE